MQDNQYFQDQEIVIQSRIKQGYNLLGTTRSLLNGLRAYVLVKNTHTLVINSLGYDEHYKGKTWALENGTS